MQHFMIPCDFGGRKAPFPIYVGEPKSDAHPLQHQSTWLSSERGGSIPQEVMDSFEKLHKISMDNNVSFEELCVYAMGEALGGDDKVPEQGTAPDTTPPPLEELEAPQQAAPQQAAPQEMPPEPMAAQPQAPVQAEPQQPPAPPAYQETPQAAAPQYQPAPHAPAPQPTAQPPMPPQPAPPQSVQTPNSGTQAAPLHQAQPAAPVAPAPMQPAATQPPHQAQPVPMPPAPNPAAAMPPMPPLAEQHRPQESHQQRVEQNEQTPNDPQRHNQS